MAVIKFHISQTGEIKIEVDGIIGETCKDITKIFEERLGIITKSEEKPEYYQVVENLQTSLYNGEK